MMRIGLFILALLLIFGCLGCSSGGGMPLVSDNPMQPALESSIDGLTADGKIGHRIPLGLYTFTADPEAGTLDIEAMRTAGIHMNGIVYLEGGPVQLIQLVGPPKFSNGGKQLDVDIKITHPHDNPLFTVFDVHGILVAKGSAGNWSETDIFIAGAEKTRLINPDGFTRWWNPKEFKNHGLYGYTPGAIGTPISVFEAATINGYKTFADGLGPTSKLSDLNPALRGMFSTGTSCTRHYTISLQGGLAFNYAVDASWALPAKVPPTPPDDFPPAANMPEPYWIEVEEWVNTLWYVPASGLHGGNVFYHITVHDWQGADSIGPVKIEIPGAGIVANVTDILEKGADYIKYDFRAVKPDLKQPANIEVLVAVDSLAGSYQPALTGVDKPLRAYNMHTTPVNPTNPGVNLPPVSLMQATTSVEIKLNESVTFSDAGSYDPDGTILSYKWDFDGDGVYGDTFDSGTDINPTKIFTKKGEFEVRLRVEDNNYATADSAPVLVTVLGITPVAAAEILSSPPYYMYYKYIISAGSSIDLDGTIVKYEWDINYDGITFNPTLFGEEIKATWDAVGDYDIMLRVEDNDGLSDFLDDPLHISILFSDNHPPVIDGLTISRTTCYWGSDTEKVALNIEAYDPDVGDTIEYKWSCDGGTFDDDTIPNPVWKSPNKVNKFYITCRVTDNHGAWEEETAPKIRVTSSAIMLPAPAPAFESERLIGTGTFKLSDYTPGKVVLINFWATW